MKLAHLILAHNHPMQLARLVTSISHPDADVYVHLDAKADISEYNIIKDMPNTFFIKKRVKVVWCEYSTIQAEINGMEEILATGIAYTHINLLSGNDYPLQSADKIQQFLFANEGKTFMWYDQVFNDWSHGQARMNNHYYGEYSFPGRYHLGELLNKLLPRRKLPNNLVAYGRSQWLTITPECAAYTLKYVRDNPAVERFFKMTWAVDEVFFQTILCNSPLKEKIVNDNLRYIVLNEAYRPVTYTIADAEALSSSGKFYARKFDGNVDSAIFDYLDKLVLH